MRHGLRFYDNINWMWCIWQYQVPFESLKRSAKERKSIIDDASRVLSGIVEESGGETASREERVQELGKLFTRLQGFKRKVQDNTLLDDKRAGNAVARVQQPCLMKNKATSACDEWIEGT